MKHKVDMAHEWYIKHSESPSFMYSEVEQAWKYADAMYAEAEKREDKTRLEALRVVRQTFINGVEQPRYAPSHKEWQPDWSQSPDGYNWFAVDENGEAYWYKLTSGPHLKHQQPFWNYDEDDGDNIKAPSFNYQGDWRESLRRRPQ